MRVLWSLLGLGKRGSQVPGALDRSNRVRRVNVRSLQAEEK